MSQCPRENGLSLPDVGKVSMRGHIEHPSMVDRQNSKPFPHVSLFGAVGFALSLLVLVSLETLHTAPPHERIVRVMLCILLASTSSIVSIGAALCPIILGGDRRPLRWVVPLLVGWMVFLQLFDWRSLVGGGG